MMHMTFYWGKGVTILFDSWKTDSWTGYALSLLACFFFSVFYQYMEYRRLRLRLRDKRPPQPADSGEAAAPLLVASKARGGGKWAPMRFAGAVMFGVNSAIGYLLMLAVMSFNAGVFLAVVVGLGVGYLFFRAGSDDYYEDVVVVDSNTCACA